MKLAEYLSVGNGIQKVVIPLFDIILELFIVDVSAATVVGD